MFHVERLFETLRSAHADLADFESAEVADFPLADVAEVADFNCETA
jgi:hypothetical protein